MKKKCNKCGHEQNVTTNAKRTTCSICDAEIPLRVLIASLLGIEAVGGSAYADITVVQENLTPQEQKVLDDITQAKANETYVAPPEDDNKFNSKTPQIKPKVDVSKSKYKKPKIKPKENSQPQEVHFQIGTMTHSKNGKIDIGLTVIGIVVSIIALFNM